MIFQTLISRSSQLGNIIHDDFSSNSIADYTQSFTTASANISGGDLILSGGDGSFSNYLLYNKSGNAFKKSNLTEFRQVVSFNLSSVGSGSTGFWVGAKSANTNTFYDVFASVDCSTGGHAVKLIFRTNGSQSALVTKSIPSVASGDEIVLEFERIGYTYFARYTNITQGFFDVISYTCSLSYPLTGGVLNNIFNHAIIPFGGTINIHSFDVFSTVNKDIENVFIGDSETQGFYAGAYGNGYAQLCKSNSSLYKKTEILASGGNLISDIASTLPEILALNPKRAWIMLGTNNVLQNIDETSSYDALITSLVNAGIDVVLFTIPACNSADMTTYNNGIASRQSGKKIIDIFAASKTGTNLNSLWNAGDGLHMSPYGNAQVANLILTTYPQYFQ